MDESSNAKRIWIARANISNNTLNNLPPQRGNRQEFGNLVTLDLADREIEKYTALLDELVANADFRQNVASTERRLWCDTRRSLVVQDSHAHLVQCSFRVEKSQSAKLTHQNYLMTLTISCRQFRATTGRPIKTFDVGDLAARLRDLSMKDSEVSGGGWVQGEKYKLGDSDDTDENGESDSH